MAVQVSEFDRLTFTLFVAVALHGILVLGVTFAPQEPEPQAQTMDITLSRFDDKKAPDEADFLAATNQQGSGTQKEKRQVTTTRKAPVRDAQVKPVTPPQPQSTPEQQDTDRQQVTTTADSERERSTETAEESRKKTQEPAKKKSLMQRSLEIASLEAKLDRQRRAYARRPRILRVTAASTLSSDNAWYVQNWVSRVTRVGNLNYPAEARRAGIYGSLRMVVVVRRDGSLEDVEILESSGSRVLDDAAIRIVRMAAPFQSFTPEMKGHIDQLEIIRTWSFQKRGLTSGQG
ncbi:energy transducer TonB [Tamilnaduibacter salinus]|uniref:Energy transducer TonB n=1 Tax=Tamilnaduibacter salinus TaxID=1484056 RepID=A0A2A2I1X6_9GAMM|nr:energy transducer TonB [Tamilnaduibacter salinus]PAV25316.1 energy transducer TonB [Tamilnaduibacter salinus]